MIAVLPPFVHATGAPAPLLHGSPVPAQNLSWQKPKDPKSTFCHIPGQAIYGVAHRIQLAQDVCRQAVLNAYGAAAIPI